MSVYKSFAIAGVGSIGIYLADEFLKAKSAGTVDEVVLLTRIVCIYVFSLRLTD